MSENENSRTGRRQAQEQSQKKSRKQNKNPKGKKGIFKKIFLAVVLLGLVVLIGGAGLFGFYASTSPKLDEKLLRDVLSSDILDINGEVIHKTGQQKREYVNYDDIPDLMENAILATEDVRFYTHHGLDFYRLGGAVLANFKSGFGSQGASTITQQVIKNSFLKNDKNLKRKSQEAWLAFQLERKYEKEEIFEMYFNKILMSGNNYGFGTAANFFYGKNLDELELHEAAMLAGLPQSPNGYNPITNPERAQKRRNIVLGLMYQHEKISKEDMEAAREIDVTSTLLADEQRESTDNTKYPAFIDVVINELEDAGLQDLLAEGIQIHTTLDPKAQSAVEEELKYTPFVNDTTQAGITVLDTKTGGIAAVGGGRNYVAGNLSFATQEKRQIGSTMKPILSYGPAIELLNWSTGQTIVDEPYEYEGKEGTPVRNFDRRFLGAMTIREALYNSRNVPAVKIYEEVGRKEAMNFASNLGINLKNDYPSNSLGGTDEFTTADVAGAYAAFGNSGIYTKPYSIKKIVFRDGKTEKNLIPDSTPVMKDSTAYMVTDMLRDVLTSGTGTRANIQGLDIAGKTGTTGFAEKEGTKDLWFAGYTTNYTIAAWAGYQKNDAMTKDEVEQKVPQLMFKNIMTTISADKETAKFKMPSSVEEVKIVYKSEPLLRASASTPSSMTRTELFVKGSVPKEVAKTIKLNAPTNLSAEYDDENKSAILNWSHKKNDAKNIKGDVKFIIYATEDGGERKQLTTTSDLSVTLPVDYGKNYTFEVVAIAGELVSDSASVTLRIEEPEEEEEDDQDAEDLEEELKQKEEEEKQKQEELEEEKKQKEEEEKQKQEELDEEKKQKEEEEKQKQEELDEEKKQKEEEEKEKQEEEQEEKEDQEP